MAYESEIQRYSDKLAAARQALSEGASTMASGELIVLCEMIAIYSRMVDFLDRLSREPLSLKTHVE